AGTATASVVAGWTVTSLGLVGLPVEYVMTRAVAVDGPGLASWRSTSQPGPPLWGQNHAPEGADPEGVELTVRLPSPRSADIPPTTTAATATKASRACPRPLRFVSS